MRLATYEHLIAAEDLALTAGDAVAGTEVVDLDMDGLDDLRIWDRGQVVTIDPSDGGGIGGWDIRAVRHALTAVMRRRPEAYHETLRRHEAAGAAGDGGGDGGAPASIHDRVMTKEAGLAERLRYDDHERRSGLVRFLPARRHPGRLGGRARRGSRATSSITRSRSRRGPSPDASSWPGTARWPCADGRTGRRRA